MRKLIVAVVSALVMDLAFADPIDSYNGLVAAINSAAAGSTVKLKAGATITVGAQVNVNKALTISGGWIDDETPGGTKTILSGGGTQDNLKVDAADVTLENIVFTATGAHAIYRSTGKNGYLVIRHCGFLDNVCTCERGGIAIYANGTASATLTVEDCVFDNNATTSTADGGYDLHNYSPNGGNGPFGLIVRMADFQSATFTRCSFTRCGVNSDHAVSGRVGFGDWNPVWGSVLGAYHTPITLSECSFRANRGATPHNNNGGGGIVYLAGKCGGSAVRNCLFVGNEELCTTKGSVGKNDWAQYNAGALVINLETSGLKAEVDGCTFAYNLSETSRSAAGLSVQKGAVTVKNSIFYGNRRSPNGVGGADLTINTDGSATVTYSVFTDDTTASVANQNGTAVQLGVGVKYGDPLFVTPLSAFTALVLENTSTHYLDTSKLADVLALDVHLKSTKGTYADGAWVTYDVDSPAIDAGDPMADFENEPTPNGGRLNAGVFGNTIEASKSDSGAIVLPTIESATISFPGGYTHPQANVTFSCDDPDADYDAAVTITLTTGGVVIASQTFPGQHPGDVVTLLAPVYPQPGTEVTMEVSVAVAGADPVTCDPVVGSAMGVLPPWYGKGGPANVIHVRADADGLGTGENWTDALTSFSAALGRLDATKTEIWISGEIVASESPQELNPATDVAIRGGFTGTENAANARVAGAVATLSGGGNLDLILLKNAENRTVTLESMRFCEAGRHAIRKSGSHGDLVIRKCVFADNVTDSDECGVALYLRGNTDKVQSSSKSNLTIEDCVFTNNVTTSVSTEQWELEQYGPNDRKKSGIAVRIAGFKQVTIARCEFIANGVPFGFRQWGGSWQSAQGLGAWSSLYGSTLCAYDAPMTMTGCSFRANRGSTPRTNATGSGIVYVGGASGGSLVQNCLFVGNEELSSVRDALGPTEWYAQHESGALVLALNAGLDAEVDGCTFAYNLCETSRSAGGLTINSGDVTVRNSIFYGNKRATKGVGGADLTVRSENNASVQVSYSSFTDNTTASVANDLGEAIELGGSIQYCDPLFVSPLSAFESLITTANTSRYFANAVLADVLALDVHLKSRNGTFVNGAWTTFDVDSPAIDAGDPAAARANEPKPNGRRVNMGCYGNTPEASLSKAMGFKMLVR